jgi:hypothetical protein
MQSTPVMARHSKGSGCVRKSVILDDRAARQGEQLSVDHIIPRAVVAELDNVIANLELMPLRVNEKKNDKIGDRQRSLARKLFEAGLLSKKGLKAVERSE